MGKRIRDIKVHVLFRSNIIISTASNGRETWEKVERESPDLVISDIMMLVMDGFKFCCLMKSTFITSHIPIILQTSLSEKAHELEGLELGADDYITKPFDMMLLEQRILSIIKNATIYFIVPTIVYNDWLALLKSHQS